MSRTASLCVAVLIFSFDIVSVFLFGHEAIWAFIFLVAVARPYLTKRHFAFIILFIVVNSFISALGELESWREYTEYIFAQIPEIPKIPHLADITLACSMSFAGFIFLGYYYFCKHLIKKLRIHERIGYALSN